jgi:hypothetical protein
MADETRVSESLIEKSLSNLALNDESPSSPEPAPALYRHLRCRPWDHMVPLLEVLSLHFGKTYDEVAEIIASDIPLIDILLADWNAKFKTQKTLVDSALTKWAQNYLYPKWYDECPSLKEAHDRRGGPEEKYPEEAARSFCFFPFTEFFFPVFGYDYHSLESCQNYPALVADMKHDYGITLKYPHLPLFGAAMSKEVDFWPIEVIQVSIAVPLMLNLM